MKNISQFNKFQLAIALGALLFPIIFFVQKTKFSPEIPYIKNDSQAQWILHPEKLFLGTHTTPNASPETTRFQKELNFNKGAEQPVIHIKAHKQAVLFVNDTKIMTTRVNNWKKETSVNLSEYLQTGKNQITIEVTAFSGRGILYSYISGLQYPWATDSSWFSEIAGGPIARAVVADDTQSDLDILSQPTTFQHLNSLTTPAILIFFFCSSIYVLAQYKLKSKYYSFLPKFSLVTLCLLWVFLFFKKMIHIPFSFGFDSPFHLEYTNYLFNNFNLPMPHEGWEFYQPPLFYIISALTIFLGKGIIPIEYNYITLKLLPFTCGLVTLAVTYKLTKKLFPNSLIKTICVVLFAGSLPVNIYISAYYTNETLITLLLSLTIILSLINFGEDKVSPAQIIPLSTILGFALLTKYTALPVYIIVFVFIGLKLFFQENASLRNSVKCLLLLTLIPLIISGWFYFRNYLHYGNILATHPDFRPLKDIFNYWQYPGFHTLKYFMTFGEVFYKPIHAGVYSFWDGFYSTFWGNGSLGGRTADTHKLWNYNYMSITYLIAFPAMFILLIGFLKSLIGAVRSDNIGQRIQHSFLICLVFAGLFIPIYHSLIYGFYSSAKAFYCLFLLTPLSILFAQGMDQTYGLLSKRTMIIPRAVLSGWFGLLLGIIWLSYLM
jgi:hypothetical protein